MTMQMTKRILFLVGADIQVSAMNKAKELGYNVIACGSLPNHPGHKFSDEYHNVSANEKMGILDRVEVETANS
jgi:hypothetical protein